MKWTSIFVAVAALLVTLALPSGAAAEPEDCRNLDRLDATNYLTRTQIEELPLAARNPLALAFLSPGQAVTQGEQQAVIDALRVGLTPAFGGGSFPDPASGVCMGAYETDASPTSPLVSGVVALMLQANPNLTYRDVKEILVRTSSDAMQGIRQDNACENFVLSPAVVQAPNSSAGRLCVLNNETEIKFVWDTGQPATAVFSRSMSVFVTQPDFVSRVGDNLFGVNTSGAGFDGSVTAVNNNAPAGIVDDIFNNLRKMSETETRQVFENLNFTTTNSQRIGFAAPLCSNDVKDHCVKIGGLFGVCFTGREFDNVGNFATATKSFPLGCGGSVAGGNSANNALIVLPENPVLNFDVGLEDYLELFLATDVYRGVAVGGALNGSGGNGVANIVRQHYPTFNGNSLEAHQIISHIQNPPAVPFYFPLGTGTVLLIGGAR